jgi:hypothetical protein
VDARARLDDTKGLLHGREPIGSKGTVAGGALFRRLWPAARDGAPDVRMSLKRHSPAVSVPARQQRDVTMRAPRLKPSATRLSAADLPDPKPRPVAARGKPIAPFEQIVVAP